MTTRRSFGTSSGVTRRRSRTERALEHDLQNDVRLLYEKSSRVRLFRNNVGVLPDKRGGYVKYGLCTGSSDLIGWRATEFCCGRCGNILPVVAVFTAIEIKRPGCTPTEDQDAFLRAVKLAGGISGWTDSIEGAIEILKP